VTLPRILRLKAHYKLTEKEVELFTLLILKVSARSAACRSWLADYSIDCECARGEESV
jgi:hypothetical protein